MQSKSNQSLRARVTRLAELIVAARPVQMHFQSEREFLALIGLPTPEQQALRQEPVRVVARNQSRR